MMTVEKKEIAEKLDGVRDWLELGITEQHMTWIEMAIDAILGDTTTWNKISPAGIYECAECGQHVMTNDISAYKYCHHCGRRVENHAEA